MTQLSKALGVLLLSATSVLGAVPALPAGYFRLMEAGCAQVEEKLNAQPDADLAALETGPDRRHFPQAILAPAVLYVKKHRDNPHYHDPKMLALAIRIGDLLARESFYKELPAIEQNTRALEADYDKRFEEALSARIAAYTKAFDRLVKAPGWGEVDEDQQRRLVAPFERGKSREKERLPIPQLRSERDACDE